MSTTIEQIKGMEDGLVITRIDGIVKALFPRKTGSSDKGEWSVQTLILAQGQSEIPVSLWNKDAIPDNIKGKAVSLVAFKGSKGWSGLYKNTGKSKDGSPRIEIRGTKSADIIVGGLDAPVDNATPEAAPVSAPVEKKAHDFAASGVYGATAGMAVKEAVTWAREQGANPADKATWEWVFNVASDIVRVAFLIESGKLAPPIKDRNKPAAEDDVAY